MPRTRRPRRCWRFASRTLRRRLSSRPRHAWPSWLGSVLLLLMTDSRSQFEECAKINALIHTGDNADELEKCLAGLTIVEKGAGEKPVEDEPDMKKDDDDGAGGDDE